jgi:hypothetical protein
MLDYAVDAPVIIEFDGNVENAPLCLAVTVATNLLSKEKVFSIKDSKENVYCTFDGEQLYSDTRIASLLSATGQAFKEV